MSEFSFGSPAVLVVVPLAAVAWLAWALGASQTARRMPALTRRSEAGGGMITMSLLAGAAMLAGVAAAQPRWGAEDAVVEQPSGNVVFAFDVSRSMDAQDVAPSRLEVARVAVASSMIRLNGDRVGLVIFAGSARLRSPLTTDVGTAATIVRALETGTRLVGSGTTTGGALELARETVGESGVVVLVTDGDDPSPFDRVAAAAFAETGVVLLVAPVGTTEGGTVPIFDGARLEYRPLTDESGAPVITRLNEEFLEALAQAAGGAIREGGIADLPDTLPSLVAAHRHSSITGDSKLPTERFQWFALPAVVLAVLAMVSGAAGPRKVPLLAGLLMVTLLAACATEAYELNEEGLDALEEGDLDGAVTLFYEAAAERPNDADIAFNLSTVLSRAGRYDEAIDVADRMGRSPRASVRARAQSLLGHHWFELGDLGRSLDAFRETLLLDAEDEDARHDYEVVYALLTEFNEEPDDPASGDGEQAGEPGEGDRGLTGEGGQSSSGTELVPRERPAGRYDLEEQIEVVNQAVQELIREAGEVVTAEEALEILELYEEMARLTALRDGVSGFTPTDH